MRHRRLKLSRYALLNHKIYIAADHTPVDFDHAVLTLPYGCNTYRNYDIYMQTVTA